MKPGVLKVRGFDRLVLLGLTEEVARVARQHGATLDAVLGSSRYAPVVAARRAVMVHLHGQGYGLAEIGRLLGRDHTTVMHHVRRAQRVAS